MAGPGTVGTRSAILALVGRGMGTEDIRRELGGLAETELRYAAALVRVRDELRTERLGAGGAPRSKAA